MKRSWSATLGLAVLLAVLAAGTRADDSRIVCDGSTTVGPIAKAFAEYFMQQNPGVNVTVSESGSGNGAKSLINGTCDVASMSRFMKDSEFKAAVAQGVLPVAHIVALDGLPIVVHPGNPIQGLTVQQVRDIFAGRITRWSELGGPELKIVKVSRDTNSGTYETFETLVMGGEKIAEDTEYVGSNGAIRQRVQTTPAAIGYAGLGFVDDTVKALEIDGIYPTRKTVASGKYPVARPLYLFTNGYPELGSNLHSFVNLHLTEKGQEIVEEIGFVPTTAY